MCLPPRPQAEERLRSGEEKNKTTSGYLHSVHSHVAITYAGRIGDLLPPPPHGAEISINKAASGGV